MIPFAIINNMQEIQISSFSYSEVFSYSGPAYATNVDVDSSGNSYWHPWFLFSTTLTILSTTGSTVSTIDTGLDVAGTNIMRLDSSGNIYVCGSVNSTSGPMVGKKYNSSGTLLWTATYSATYVLGSSLSLTIDSSNNLYLAGANTGGASVRKYDSSGTLLATLSTSNIVGICCDTNYLYMTIGSNVMRTNLTFGSQSTFTGADLAYWVDVDNSGNVYVQEYDNTPPLASYVRKYNSSGTSLWRTKIRNTSVGLQNNMIVDRVNGRVFTSDESNNILILDTNGNITGTFPAGGTVYAIQYRTNTLWVGVGNSYKKFDIS
jgi:hypothetical protein